MLKVPSTEKAGWRSNPRHGEPEKRRIGEAGVSGLQASPPSESTGFVGFDWNQIFGGKRHRLLIGSIVQHRAKVGTAWWESPPTEVGQISRSARP